MPTTLKLPMKPDNFMQLGLRYAHHPAGERNFRSELKTFRSYFGINPSNVAILWGKIREKNLAPRATPTHLLMGLYFLTVYSTDEVSANHFKVHEETYREWSWHMIQVIAKLKPDYVSLRFAFQMCIYAKTIPHLSCCDVFTDQMGKPLEGKQS